MLRKANLAIDVFFMNINALFMESQEVVYTGQSTVDVAMVSETVGLDEVIAVGYGFQKKSVVTASIAKVSSDELKNVTPTRVDNVLKGLASGVTVTASSGQSGASSQIRIRGIGTINDSDPLFIVNGMPVDGGIDYLNPSDILSVEVLKDAASGAVYGARAANGVILVTTKSGSKDKVLYYLSAGYYSQDGIVGGNYGRSNYDRFTLRSNITLNLMDDNDRLFLNKFKVGMNTAYSKIKSTGISTNSEYGSILGSAVALSPLLGVYEEDQDAAIQEYEVKGGHTLIRDPENDMIYTIAGASYNEITNPLAQLTLPGQIGNSDKFVSTFWGELTIWDNLKFKTSLGTDLAFWGNDGWTPKYYLGQSNYSDFSSVWSSMNRSFVDITIISHSYRCLCLLLLLFLFLESQIILPNI